MSWRLVGFLSVLGLAIFMYYSLLQQMPALSEEDRQHVTIPRSLDDTKALARVLLKYRDDYFTEVTVWYITSYVLVQTFCIPVALFLTILAGALMQSLYLGLLVVCLSCALGASGAYALSYFFLYDNVAKWFPKRISEWRKKVGEHKNNMVFYMLFLRATPILPNWFISLASPVIGVPFIPFFLGTLIGVAPPCMLYIEGGMVLEQLSSTSELMPASSLLRIFAIGCLALLPVIFKDRIMA
eukprot:m.359885 g.359885  ORF g.359885 m.359885 type:complete len:241 (+) comp18791_c0_seq1:97-819(+)